jgi:hypothetical protein
MMIRTFTIIREQDRTTLGLPLGVIAEGVEFSDGTVVVNVLAGRGADRPPFIWKSLAQALEVHAHFGDSRVEFD